MCAHRDGTPAAVEGLSEDFDFGRESEVLSRGGRDITMDKGYDSRAIFRSFFRLFPIFAVPTSFEKCERLAKAMSVFTCEKPTGNWQSCPTEQNGTKHGQERKWQAFVSLDYIRWKQHKQNGGWTQQAFNLCLVVPGFMHIDVVLEFIKRVAHKTSHCKIATLLFDVGAGWKTNEKRNLQWQVSSAVVLSSS